jgi:hypothetical protein
VGAARAPANRGWNGLGPDVWTVRESDLEQFGHRGVIKEMWAQPELEQAVVGGAVVVRFRFGARIRDVDDLRPQAEFARDSMDA